jgi:asparagine synthase (glutamine-hydrolysing)
MCGILGSINRRFDEQNLIMLSHRGPDDSGLVRFSVNGHEVSLGHRRLSIVDLTEAGHQPMFSSCGRHAVVFNGEIYNHLMLRAQIRGAEFRGHSDTETMLYYLMQKGIEGARDFNGIFAFCYADLTRGKLYLVRDPHGVKPLYYCVKDGFLIFSSELRPIQKMVHDTLNPGNLAELLRLRFLPSPDTLLKDIKKVRPGHILEVDLANDSLTAKENNFLATKPKPATMSFDEAVERYAALFDDAVKQQLMSDVEVGVLLSGGVDSALVAAHAQKYSRNRIKAFTVGFKEQDDSDEIEDARETASLLGLEHHCVKIGFDDFGDMFRKCASIVEEPLATTSIIPMFYLSKLAARQVKVVLSGQGADESLGGYGRYKGELLHELLPTWLFKRLGPLTSTLGVRRDNFVRALRSLGEKNELERFQKIYSVFSDEEIMSLTGRRDERSLSNIGYLYELLDCKSKARSVERMMSLDLRLNLSDDLLLYTDKVTMHHSIECRVPMLDMNLVQFIESLPGHYRVTLRDGKIIHKKFAASVLPRKIIRRKKKGFTSPTKQWFKNKAVRDILTDKGSKFARHFDGKAVTRVLDEHVAGLNRERHIFLLLSIHQWMSEYL